MSSSKTLTRRKRRGLASLVSAVRRRLRRPTLSVVMPYRDAQEFIEKAIRSVLNQSLRDLEILVVDDHSSDGSASIVRRLAARDRRIRPLCSPGCGPGAARNIGVRRAKGRYLTFVDADDVVLPGSYEVMIARLRAGAELVMGGYLRHGSQGTHRPTLVSRIHDEDHFGITAEQYPAVLEEPVLWNKMCRTAWWRKAVGSIPEDLNYEDQLPAIVALVAAQRIDVLQADVYSWRLSEGRQSRSQTKHTVADLKDRLEVVRRISAALTTASRRVQNQLLTTWISRDLPMYSGHYLDACQEYRDLIRQWAEVLWSRVDTAILLQVGFRERLELWALACADDQVIEEILSARIEDPGTWPMTIDDHSGRHVADVLTRVSGVPAQLCRVSDVDLSLQCQIRSVSWLRADLALLLGDVVVPGVASRAVKQLHAVLMQGSEEIEELELVRVPAPWADARIQDRWLSYADSGIEIQLPIKELDGQWIQLQAQVAGIPITVPVPMPVVAHSAVHTVIQGRSYVLAEDSRARLTITSGSEIRTQPFRVTISEARIEGSTLVLTGTRRSGVELSDIWLCSSRENHRAQAVIAADGTWQASFDLAADRPSYGGYFMRWSAGAQTGPEGWCHAADSLPDGPWQLDGECRSVKLARRPGQLVALTITTPVPQSEQIRYLQQRWSRSVAEPIRDAIVFESFSGKTTGDNPGAICAALMEVDLKVPKYWSVIDGTVPIPQGCERLIIGSRRWYEVMRSARIIITNNTFSHWFHKRAGQYILQTWHGTPIKRLGFDAPKDYVPTSYRRILRSQAAQWDLMLAQSEWAAEVLSRALGYEGEVYVGEQPRNIQLAGTVEDVAEIRRGLGLDKFTTAVLYAPTWRQAARDRVVRTEEELLDISVLAQAADITVMQRAHHMNRLTTGISGVIDVSGHVTIEKLLLAADVLVSDYSSVFFDFELLDRPAYVYAPDYETYRDKERGFYLNWPDPRWPMARDPHELLEWITASGEPTKPLRGIDPSKAEQQLAAISRWVRERLGTS